MTLSPAATSLARAIEIGQWPLEMVGSTSTTYLAWVLSQSQNSAAPRFVICANEKTAKKLRDDLQAFRPELIPTLLLASDESPYSGLYPSSETFKSRTYFLWRALRAQPNEIFISSIEGVLQKTLPITVFGSGELTLKKGDEIDLSTVTEHLVTCGYSAAPLVEDVGSFSKRGDILDIFSPSMERPYRIELFGDQIESLRLFDVESQLSSEEVDMASIIPCREIILTDGTRDLALEKIRSFCDAKGIKKEVREQLTAPLRQKILAHGIDFWFSFFYEKTASPLDAFSTKPLFFLLDELDVLRAGDEFQKEMTAAFNEQVSRGAAVPEPERVYQSIEEFLNQLESRKIKINKIHLAGREQASTEIISTKAFDCSDFKTVVRAAREAKKDFFIPVTERLTAWKKEGLSCFIFAATQTQSQRIQYLLESHGMQCLLSAGQETPWNDWIQSQKKNISLVNVLPRSLSESVRFASEEVVFLKDEDLFGSVTQKEHKKTKGTLEQRAGKFAFGDLSPGDFIVHTLHGVGVYEGLKKMSLQNTEAEYLQLKYKDNDKLYLPVYRISQVQKYSSPLGSAQLDKLGSTSWQRAKIKVRNDLKEVAKELLDLYAKRKASPGFAFSQTDDAFKEFEGTFPYDETPDQLKAINDVLEDMQMTRPMDRLVCGDVGFGKTEVAIRAAFKCVQDKKQVALLVPTTILAFQHYQTFLKRFKDEPLRIAMFSRFTTAAEIKKNLLAIKEGKIDVAIGTHRLLSKDVDFKDLGLLIIDEEQKFGVVHKEKIKKFRARVDVLTLSATPIPRTLNMGLMGIRDLSLISTPPEDRLAIRTFISRFDDETIRKAILGEMKRGGQVYFIHNRVQSINEFTEKIKSIVPEARIRIGHGQMPDEELEKTMLDFYNHEYDVLICTTIIESGLDIPRANTLIVDRADTFGLSQLYQLRGRVGRGKDRAYAYLLIPQQGVIDKTAAERLKILQDNTELGSGFQIAHHDLELRGSGNLLGEDQSGHIAAVGYELYMELLDQALHEAKGEPQEDDLEPDINLKVPAFIPDTYIEDIRIRLSYYKILTEIRDENDLDKIERELVDRFGQLPDQVTNLFGLMLIRKICKDLGVRDITAGPKNLSLIFSSSTKVKPEGVIRLATHDSKKYQITPEQKLIIRFSSPSWAPILEELRHLKNSLL